jgi:hypothetical protein
MRKLSQIFTAVTDEENRTPSNSGQTRENYSPPRACYIMKPEVSYYRIVGERLGIESSNL